MRRAFPILLVLLIACGPQFYEAPPSVGSYPERISAKRWHHLFKETSPLDPALPGASALDVTCRKLPEALIPLNKDKRLAEIDRLLGENRNGPYSSRRANFLHELRELATESPLFDRAKPYLSWRIDDDSPPPPIPPEQKPWNMDDAQFKNLQNFYQAQVRERITAFDARIAQSPTDLKPYFSVRRAAFLFDLQRYADAEKDFEEIISGFPGHPRAEASGLMRARCMIEQARVSGRAGADGQPDAALLEEAENLLHDHITRYPKGRFTPDAEGWLGAIAWDRKQFGTAVKQQLARLDRQPTRETTRSVLRECDRIFEELLKSFNHSEFDSWLDEEKQFNAAAVARHPLIARLFVHHCIDPAADVSLPLYWDEHGNGGHETIDYLKQRIFKPAPLVRLALKELGKELLTATSKTDPSTLTLLAWAATGEGEHEQALALLDQIQIPAPSDEILHARAIILQRLERHAEAVAAFDALAKDFPNSPLVLDLVYRRSISLSKCGRTGEAIAAIAPLVFPESSNTADDGTENPDTPPNLYPSSQLTQWLDTFIRFSPLDQLETALAAVPAGSGSADLLHNAIRTRALAGKRFDLAEKHLTQQTAVPENDWEWLKLSAKLRMTRTDWDLHAAPLAALYTRLRNNTGDPSGKAALHLAIARQWMDNRGFLTLPAVVLCYYAESEEEKQDLLRRRNALELGFQREDINRELDHHDEATHALEHALEAANSPDPAIAAPALELANQCLFRRAEFSLYQKSRAMETHDSDLSKDLHRQLTERFPNAPEATRAVYFTFTPVAGPWMPGDYNPSNSASALMKALLMQSSPDANDHGAALEKIEAVLARFANPDPKTPLPAIRRDLIAAQRELAALRPKTDPDSQEDVVAAITRLDNLSAAASLHNIRTEDFILYANGETDKLPPAFISLSDYQNHLENVTDESGNDIGPKNDTIDGWRSFLELYPDSPKAEAASFRMTRLIARKYRTSRLITAIQFPEAPIPNGYKHLNVVRTDSANEPETVLSAIRDHERRFPMGRYQDDLNLLRAGALIDTGDFPHALALLDNILENPVQRDLHVIAALEFADISQRLLDPQQRAAIAKAMRRTPGGLERLNLLVNGDTFLSRLQPLMPWLESPDGIHRR